MEPDMKKHPDADALATRLAAAANQPVSVVPFPVTAPPEAEVAPLLPAESEGEPAIEVPKRRKRGKARATQSAEQPEDDTVPISLRPSRELLMRYVLAASDRTRETGRVISAQQIMLERLDGGP
jgi:hypothetical protein